jgi:hypothetical protein
MSFDSITNRGEFFSNHYLEAVIAGDLGDLRHRWDEAESAHKDTARSRIRSLASRFFPARAEASEASATARPEAVRRLNTQVLEALGFTVERRNLDLNHTTTDLLTTPVAASVETGSGLLLIALDAGLADDVDDLFDTSASADVQLLEPLWKAGEKRSVPNPAESVSEIFAADNPPRWVLVVAGRIVLLAERAKWSEGRFLAVDLDAALERNDIKKAGELDTIAGLFSTDVLVPDEGQSVIDELDDKSHKHAVGVSKDLREGIRHSIELLANEVIDLHLARTREQHRTRFAGDEVKPRELTTQCLRYLYRLLVLLYAESRPELGILPVNDEIYLAGYSLDRLRELVLVDLDTDVARNGSHLDHSLRTLFELVNGGYHAEHAETAIHFDLHAVDPVESYEDYLQFPGLNAALFDAQSTPLLDGVTLRNEALQQILRLLMLSPEGKGKTPSRGFISYRQLGINQLGAVYEGLMAYTGFFADDDLFEVAEDGDPSDGTWVVPVTKADEYPSEVFVTRVDPLTGHRERVLHAKGSFVFRLSGRDRQRSASYYTPEVLTRCVVKHALAELLGLDDYAPEHGSSGITEARKILDLTICEPALGSGAFLNEAINQLSAAYLRRRQAELGESLDPEQYNRELQKVKAHFALHQSYGVDLNATAVELAEVSLWLNCMHPGLKAPWFGMQLRRGNSLVGCRRATWRTSQLNGRPWAQTTKDKLQPPIDRPLADPLEADEIHHFVLPGHGWAAVADRSEAKEFRPDRAKGLRDWRKAILAAPSPADAARLTALAGGIERLWASATDRLRLAQYSLRRPIEVWGAGPMATKEAVTRESAIGALEHPDSALSRLRTVMDAWIGLWFWNLDTNVTLPTWKQWLSALEDLTDPDAAVGSTGQLDTFDDLQALLDDDEWRTSGRPTVAQVREKHAWLDVAVDLARLEGAWHWELEFAPELAKGGFDLQVGNPPWVRPRWLEDSVLAEIDPWWGIAEKPPASVRKQRRSDALKPEPARIEYLAELASAEGLTEVLGSPILRSVFAGVQTNLYMLFMDAVWRHGRDRGIAGLLHPESHFSDPNGAVLRSQAYGHLRRHIQFSNLMGLFPDIAITGGNVYSANVYGAYATTPSFMHVSGLLHPETMDLSLSHDGSGELPGTMHPWGEWDLRPHAARIVTVTESVLANWARLFDEPGTPAAEARLLRPITRADLNAISVLAGQPVRLADHDYYWTRGHEEDRAKRDGIIEWNTRIPSSWSEVILQGPHFTIATPLVKQPNENCKHNQDYSEWDLETLPERAIPRTNYQRACDRDTYEASLDHWNGRPAQSFIRVGWRAMTQAGLERSLHPALLPPDAAHTNGIFSAHVSSASSTAIAAGLWSSIPVDYLVKLAGTTNLHDAVVRRLPLPLVEFLTSPLLLRTLRLNCLTASYAPLWEHLFDAAWAHALWALPHATVDLGRVGPAWDMTTPLRRDVDRRQGLVEIDALAALILGLSAEQLCAMYRTLFPVLRKYEYAMAFDADGRKLCAHHQSSGYRQARLQDHAKAGDLPAEWKSVWKLYEQWEDDPDSVDWRGHFRPPFYRPNREGEMTTAYNEFQRRLDTGQYGSER